MNRAAVSGRIIDESDLTSQFNENQVADLESIGIQQDTVDPRGRWSKKIPWTRRILFWDWVISLSLLLLSGVARLFAPHHQQIIENDWSIMLELRQDTIPTWLCAVFSVGIPTIIFIANDRLMNRDPLDPLRSLLGLTQTVSLATFVTCLLKNFIGRPRPNFMQLCDYRGGSCQQSTYVINNAFRSFPSGHSSVAFSGLLYLSLWLLGKSRICCTPGITLTRILGCISPIALASFIAATRIRDHWHHHDDVIAGMIIGSAIAIFVYRLHYPSIWHSTHPDRPVPIPIGSDY